MKTSDSGFRDIEIMKTNGTTIVIAIASTNAEVIT
jgi:hypothetical protein